MSFLVRHVGESFSGTRGNAGTAPGGSESGAAEIDNVS
jgi:hypothetical protein